MYGCARLAGRIRSAICAAIALAPQPAAAGAWTEPQGDGQMILTLYGWSGDGSPWGGKPGVSQTRADLQTYVEYGITDDVTVFGQMAIERYELSPPQASSYTGLDYSDAGLRAKLWTSGQWVFSGEMTVFAPGATNARSPAQAGNTGPAAEARGLAGYSFTLGGVPGFANLELAYRVRTAGPPDEWHLDATIGLKPWPDWILMLQDYTTVSAPATDPAFPAWKQNVAQASLVFPIWDRWQLQIGYFQSLLAVKTNTQRGAAIALWRTF